MIIKTERDVLNAVLEPLFNEGKSCLFALHSRFKNSYLISLICRNLRFFKKANGSIAFPICPSYGSKQKSDFGYVIRLVLIVRE